MSGQALKVGDMIYVSLAYDMDTREQTKRDEYSEQIGEVQELAENDALVFIPARFASDDVSKETHLLGGIGFALAAARLSTSASRKIRREVADTERAIAVDRPSSATW